MRNKTIIVLAVFLFLAVSVILVFSCFTPAARAHRLIDSGNKYLSQDKYSEAISTFIKATEIEPKNVIAKISLGRAYLGKGENINGENALKEVLTIEPENIDARIELVNHYLKVGKVSESDMILQELKALDSTSYKNLYDAVENSKTILASKEIYTSGMELLQEGKYIEAIDAFKKVNKNDVERYLDSKKRIAECQNKYTNINIDRAKDEAKNKSYAAAIDYINLALSVLPDNQEAIKLKDNYNEILKNQNSKPVTAEEAVDIAIKYENDVKYKGKCDLFATTDDVNTEIINGIKYYIFPVRAQSPASPEIYPVSGWYAVRESDGKLLNATDYLFFDGDLKQIQ